MKQQYDSYKPSGIDWIGEIPSHWEIVKFSYAISKIADIDHYMPASIENGYPYLMIGDLKERCSDIDFKNCKQISEEDYMALSKKIRPLKGDLILARYASIGNVSFVDIDYEFVVSYGCLTIRTRKDFMNSKYLFHVIRSDQFANECNQYINSNTQGNLGLDSLNKVKIILPPLEEQEGIAAWLDKKCGEIDAAIAKFDREIELIDELKQSEISRVVTRGLNPNAALRPSGIDWIGDIPEHWEICRLKNCAKVVLGKMLMTEPPKGQEFEYTCEKYLKSRNIGWLELNINEVEEMWFNKSEKEIYELHEGDVVVNEGGDIGKAAVWHNQNDSYYIQNSVHKVSPTNSDARYLSYWIYFLSKKEYFWSIVSQV